MQGEAELAAALSGLGVRVEINRSPVMTVRFGERLKATRTPSPLRAAASSASPLHVDRSKAHSTFLEILLRSIRRQAEARPIGGYDAGRKSWRPERRSGGRPAASGLHRYCRMVNPCARSRMSWPKLRPPFLDAVGERAIKLAMGVEELPVIGIEAHDIGR